MKLESDPSQAARTVREVPKWIEHGCRTAFLGCDSEIRRRYEANGRRQRGAALRVKIARSLASSPLASSSAIK
jgi:hypothetical protein